MNTTSAVRSAASSLRNPILPGCYPDPSICRAGDDYYLVTSSFAYFPGVPIFHSRDLIHWRQIGHVLDRPSQLNLTNQEISAGIFAPAIRYHEGLFYMITTFALGCGNFFVATEDPAGPWSDPVVLREIDGIDPSFFFDDDGRAYIINNGPPPGDKPLYDGHRAIWLQEFDLHRMTLTGRRKIIINGGTDLSRKPIWIEAPHLFRRNGYYYLIAAEGGTSYEHSEVVFRSRSIWGPYEPFVGNPILTQRDLPANRPTPVTCAGHADFVQTPSGDWMAVFLACQTYEGDRYYNTGRETFLLPVDWSGEWPIILPQGQAIPAITRSPLPACSNQKTFSEYSLDWCDNFTQPHLKPEWNFIRTPKEQWYELRPGRLVMTARPVAITERANPSFVGRRAQHAHARFSTTLTLEPGRNMQAGIVAFQNERFFYSFLLHQVDNTLCLRIASSAGEHRCLPLSDVPSGTTFYLRLEMHNSRLQFAYSLDQQSWIPVGDVLDARQLSTTAAGGFLGAYFGLYAFADTPAHATFTQVHYLALSGS